MCKGPEASRGFHSGGTEGSFLLLWLEPQRVIKWEERRQMVGGTHHAGLCVVGAFGNATGEVWAGQSPHLHVEVLKSQDPLMNDVSVLNAQKEK